MAPTLRSAQNSPAASMKSSVQSANTTPTTTPTRKVPQCSRCNRPRAGHPRSGCPFADAEPMSKINLTSGTPNTPGHLATAMGSMILGGSGSTDTEDDTKPVIKIRGAKLRASKPLVRTDSTHSLATNSHEIAARLSQPGALSDAEDTGRGKWATARVAAGLGAPRIVRWQDLVSKAVEKNKRRTPARSPMPGTLIPPSPESSFMSSTGSASVLKEESPSGGSARALRAEPTLLLDEEEEWDSESASESTVGGRGAPPLMRSMSSVERDLFVSRLSGEAPATIYIVPKADVDDIVDEAISLKFITELVMNEDEDDPNALIILGREAQAVQTLLRKVENENRKAQASKSKGSTLRTAAGAVVVGAVGAWAGLAFT